MKETPLLGDKRLFQNGAIVFRSRSILSRDAKESSKRGARADREKDPGDEHRSDPGAWFEASSSDIIRCLL